MESFRITFLVSWMFLLFYLYRTTILFLQTFIFAYQYCCFCFNEPMLWLVLKLDNTFFLIIHWEGSHYFVFHGQTKLEYPFFGEFWSPCKYFRCSSMLQVDEPLHMPKTLFTTYLRPKIMSIMYGPKLNTLSNICAIVLTSSLQRITSFKR